MKHLLYIAITFSVFFSFEDVNAQGDKTKVEILHADSWKFDASVNDMQRLIGNVRLRQDQTYMYCDSAWMYDDAQRFDAFSKVRIEKGDSLRLSGDLLSYDSADKMARLRKNIRFSDRKMTLLTQSLDYNLDTETGAYIGGGVITGSSGDELRSREGIYFVKSGIFHFRKDVTLTNADYTVKSDTLHYNERTTVSKFFGPTFIRSKTSEIYCERGYFNSKTEESAFIRNAVITSDNNILKGDSILYFGKTEQGNAFGNVEITDTIGSYFIRGHQGFHDDKKEITYVTNRALLVRPFEKDTLFLHADTLRTSPTESGSKLILGIRNVRFFKTDLQGRSDTLIYADRDSLITMKGDPVLWNEMNQISGEIIKIRTWDNDIEKLVVERSGRIMSEAMPGKYNQVAGREIVGYFHDNELNRIHVSGNAESVYFPTETKDETVRSMGLNGVRCSVIDISMEDGELTEIKFRKDPVGSMKPNKEVLIGEKLLKGFFWRDSERPTDGADVFRKVEKSTISDTEVNDGPRVVK